MYDKKKIRLKIQDRLEITSSNRASGRLGGLMVSSLDSGSNGPCSTEPWPGSLCCVLKQDTLL